MVQFLIIHFWNNSRRKSNNINLLNLCLISPSPPRIPFTVVIFYLLSPLPTLIAKRQSDDSSRYYLDILLSLSCSLVLSCFIALSCSITLSLALLLSLAPSCSLLLFCSIFLSLALSCPLLLSLDLLLHLALSCSPLSMPFPPCLLHSSG